MREGRYRAEVESGHLGISPGISVVTCQGRRAKYQKVTVDRSQPQHHQAYEFWLLATGKLSINKWLLGQVQTYRQV